MRFSFIAAAAALAVVGAASLAVAQTPPLASIPLAANASMKAADAPGGLYNIDPRHSNVVWRLRHNGVSLFTANFEKISGTLNFNPIDPTKSVIDVTIPVNSLAVNVWNAQGERAFQKEIANNFLGAEANPNITFKSTSIKSTGPTTGLVQGDLTLKGVTKPAVLEVTFEGGRLVGPPNQQKYRIGFTGRTIIDRTAFGVSAAGIDATTSKEVEIIVNSEMIQN